MSFDFKNETPIYLQIIELIKMQIITKEYLPNQKLPSVRELSMLYEVNPNTIQKSLGELEDMGLIYTERTNGKFVTNDCEVIERIRKETINAMVDNFYESMAKVGIDKKSIIEILKGKE